MEISFNPSNIPDPAGTPPVTRRDAASSAQESNAFDNTDALKNSLNNLPTVRPEKVAHARALVSDVSYPPNYVLDRIANLLAMHINK